MTLPICYVTLQKHNKSKMACQERDYKMTINTKKVKGRRKVRYESLDDLLEEAKRLSQGETQTLGNWSPGQIYKHFAWALDSSIDGIDFSMPAPLRLIMTVLFKNKFLNKSLPPGFKSVEKYIPEETSTEEGIALLEEAIQRQKQETSRVPHPAFGNIGVDGWNRFHLRHAEMHMSFIVSNEAD